MCRYGEFISDVVVYDFAKFFTRGRKDLYVESPAVVHTMVNVTTMEVNRENVAHFMVKNSENLSWWQRLKKGWYPMCTPCTPHLHTFCSLPGQQLLLPVSAPLNDHWVLVVLFKRPRRVCIKVVDSLHWKNKQDGIHARLTAQLTMVTQLMGFTEAIVNVTEEQVVPVEQRGAYNFCGFHVLARVWMAATNQSHKWLHIKHVDTIRRYIQYMTLSKEIMKHPMFGSAHIESEEEEFQL